MLDELLRLGGVEPRRRLVEQQDLRLRVDRARELEESPLTVRKTGGRLLGQLDEPYPIERPRRRVPPGTITAHGR